MTPSCARSKLNTDTLKEGVAFCLAKSKEKPRKFLETVELQIALKDYDTAHYEDRSMASLPTTTMASTFGS